MVKSDSHIDVLFRDKLRDTEILPPSSVWNNIQPSIRKKSNNAFIFRLAAAIAVLTSLSLLAYYYAGSVINAEQQTPLVTAENNLNTLFDASYIDLKVDQQKTDDGFISETTLSEVNNDISGFNPLLTDVPDRMNNQSGVSFNFDDVSNEIVSDRDQINTKSRINEPLADNVEYMLLPVEADEEIANRKRWQLGAMISPTYLSSNLKAANQALNELTDNEDAVLSYTGGFSFSYKMNSRLSIQTGIYYSSLGRQISGVNSYSGFAPYASSKSGNIFGVETSSGTVKTTNSDIFLQDVNSTRVDGFYSVDNFDPVKSELTYFGDKLRQSFEYLEIPLMLRYKVIDRKLDFNILGGMSYNFLIGNNTWIMNDNGGRIHVGATDNVDNLLLSSSLGMSMEYNFNERISLNLEPQFRYYLNTGGELGAGNPYTFGVFSGMQFKF